ncbi:hypothetical protein [Anaplasma phagocytophilum]|uniref:hypothetical protein n=1 Tax=Anaplasma phagocytophilum TaxID=948 RepID=UPI00200D7CCC|nr:hypothetical protein [Anaplasma phagocytophilum]UQD54409.1 hypothetical protein ESP60_03505 [Anaplasma phagocytophilum]
MPNERSVLCYSLRIEVALAIVVCGKPFKWQQILLEKIDNTGICHSRRVHGDIFDVSGGYVHNI